MKIKDRIRNSGIGRAILDSYIYIYIRDYKRIKSILNLFKKKNTSSLMSDMVNAYRKHKVPYNEYLLFNFDLIKDSKDREQFVNDNERLILAGLMNRPENDPIFYNKENTYNMFKKYYLRNVLRINSKCKISEFIDFVTENPRFISKPLDGGCGIGIKIIDAKNAPSYESLFYNLIKEYKGNCIVEELIEQVNSFKELHSSSVNTVRMPTICFSERVEVIHPFLRIGCGNSITDNAGSGGIICPVNANGVVFAAADEFGNSFTIHPDSKKELIGFQIPKWDEAVELVKELALCIPTNRYCSWDIALTPKGWVLVEANAKGQFVWQYATHVGFRQELNSIMKELGL